MLPRVFSSGNVNGQIMMTVTSVFDLLIYCQSTYLCLLISKMKQMNLRGFDSWRMTGRSPGIQIGPVPCVIQMEVMRWRLLLPQAKAHFGSLTQSVSYLHVKMQYILAVHELDSLADLSHEHGARSFSQHEVLVYDSLEQFSTSYPGREDIQCITNIFIFLRRYE